MLLLEQLKQIPDHRGVKGRKYPLWVLMAIVVIGTFCGYEGYRPLADFCRKYQKKLWLVLNIEESMDSPSYSTLRRIMLDVKPQHWEVVFNAWALTTMPKMLGRCSSIDGKSIKCTSSGGQTAQQDLVSLVSVYNHSSGGVLPLKVMHNKKISEIEVARELIDNLKNLPFRQCFSLDALPTQTQTVEKILAANHNYLMAVKENQPKLYQTLEKIAATCQPKEQATTRDYSQGRFVQPIVSLFEAPEHLQKKWKALKTLIRVERNGIRDHQVLQEIAYYLSNEQLSAEVFLKDIQGHWSIENRLHWVKDVTFSEDAPPRRGGDAPVNWAILVSWLITLVRRAGFRTVPQARRLWANQVDEIFALLS